jgi:L-threonylcarbamoyladenylate synthase
VSYVTESFDGEVVRLLKQGRVGFMPSDTIYSLSGRALDKKAASKLYTLKKRQAHKPFIILISDLKMLDLLSIKKEEAGAIEKYWPGPVTLICSAPNSPDWLNQGLGSLAVRMPANQDLLNLISQTGPLISTSANLEGQPTSDNVAQALAAFGDELDFYIDMGEIQGQPSTIVKLDNGKLQVLRPGAAKIS